MAYAGRTLQSRDICYWKVRTWDADGLASDWSEPSRFEIGLLQESDWKAKWIGERTTEKTQLRMASAFRKKYAEQPNFWPVMVRQCNSPLLRKEFAIGKGVKRARVYFSGLGLSALHFNGKKVTDDVLSPMMTDYHSEVSYRVHDVTSLLKKGDNVVGIWLGNGGYSAQRSAAAGQALTAPALHRFLIGLQIEKGKAIRSVTQEGSQETLSL